MKKFLLMLVLVFASTALTACGSVNGSLGGITVSTGKHAKVKSKRHGPPPHAPAHGYRCKAQDGVEIVFDSGLDAYVVVKVSNTYFYDGLFVRLTGDNWEVAVHLDGPWRNAASKEVPLKLKKAKGKANGKGNGNGHRKG